MSYPSPSPQRPPSLTTLVSMVTLKIVLFTVVTGLCVVECAKPSFQQSAAAEHRMLMQDRAILHVNLMNTAGMCRDPRPTIIYPPPSPNKQYYPRGTLLHRCTDQTGCCQTAGEVCRPDQVVEISKVFFVNHLVTSAQKGSGVRLAPRLKAPRHNFTTLTESLTFLNHTTCKCVKLAPHSIEHDDLRSVVSRPLVDPANSISSSSLMYHMIGTAALIAAIMVAFLVYRCFFLNHRRRALRHNRV